MFNYKFCIEVDIQGRQRPSIKFSHNKNLEQLEHLSHLAYGYMSSSAYVGKEVLEGIQDVISNKKEVHHFAGDDWCMVSFRNSKSLISSVMGWILLNHLKLNLNYYPNLLKIGMSFYWLGRMEKYQA